MASLPLHTELAVRTRYRTVEIYKIEGLKVNGWRAARLVRWAHALSPPCSTEKDPRYPRASASHKICLAGRCPRLGILAGTGYFPPNKGAPSSSEPVRRTLCGSSPVGIASLMGAVGSLGMERLFLPKVLATNRYLHKFCCQKMHFSRLN